jgi:hypothetical protein
MQKIFKGLHIYTNVKQRKFHGLFQQIGLSIFTIDSLPNLYPKASTEMISPDHYVSFVY